MDRSGDDLASFPEGLFRKSRWYKPEPPSPPTYFGALLFAAGKSALGWAYGCSIVAHPWFVRSSADLDAGADIMAPPLVSGRVLPEIAFNNIRELISEE